MEFAKIFFSILPIDPNFQANRFPIAYNTLKVWKNASSTLGIYGTDVAVDFDSCIGDGACVEVCPVNVFDWYGCGADRKALPIRERDCIYCFGCEAVCPKFAIRVTKQQT
ncbi:MAG: ferredoxin family protein [Thermoproteota archaeon]|nr:ferredoxin family protein [Thermoproteota archaeon]